MHLSRNCLKNKELLEEYIKEEEQRLEILRKYRKMFARGSITSMTFYDKRIGETRHNIRALKFSLFCVNFYIDTISDL